MILMISWSCEWINNLQSKEGKKRKGKRREKKERGREEGRREGILIKFKNDRLGKKIKLVPTLFTPAPKSRRFLTINPVVSNGGKPVQFSQGNV